MNPSQRERDCFQAPLLFPLLEDNPDCLKATCKRQIVVLSEKQYLSFCLQERLPVGQKSSDVFSY